MKKLYLVLIAIILFQSHVSAQDNIKEERFGRHTYSEWRYMIDTTWGFGQTTAEKLQVFDDFWTWIDEVYAGFYGIEDNWDSLLCYYDSVSAGVSRGRFAGILTYMASTLHDAHANITNNVISATPLGRDVPLIVPFPNDVPMLWGSSKHFGAGLTPLPDSTLLVYAAVNNHPLNLVPGDIVLGYDGILWKNIYPKIFCVQFPMIWAYNMGCSEDAVTHQWLSVAGMNWHLFDTLDVVKYASGDTVHLPTSLITGPLPGIRSTEQMPINGVPFPDVESGQHVSWGYVEGTKIGYIYVLSWSTFEVSAQFLNAVNVFMPDTSSDGLIIDIRTNQGGGLGQTHYPPGFRRLFNEDQDVMEFLDRADPTNHLAMRLTGAMTNIDDVINTDNDLYDRPIAVLCGPNAISAGDMSVQVLRHHPMARTFGKPTNGAFGLMINDTPSEWSVGLTESVAFTPPDWNDILNRTSIPVDEEVWLTPYNVANGKDDVVEKALDWINNLVYAHKTITDKTFYSPGEDTIRLSTIIDNPNSHQLSAKAYFETFENVAIDSFDLVKQTLNNGGENWVGSKIAPSIEEFFKLSVTAFDQTNSTSFTTTKATSFTTAGPVEIESIQCTPGSLPPRSYKIKPFIRNLSDTATLMNITSELICDDPWVEKGNLSENIYPGIPPGTTVGATGPIVVQYIDSLLPNPVCFNFRIKIKCNGWTYWTDSIKVIVGVDEEIQLATEYRLEQNFPNPFNPNTVIKYSVPQTSQVQVKVYDILGNEIEILVSEEKSAGTYEINWSAANLPSGVYFYQLRATPNGGQAGDFVETKKMILMK